MPNRGIETGSGKKLQNKSQGYWVIVDVILSYFHLLINLLSTFHKQSTLGEGN